MTRLVRVQLGTAPGQGKQGVDQAAAFKRQLRSVLPAVEGASLLTISDHGRMTVEAVYDADRPGTSDWAKQAADLAAEVWLTLSDRRKARGR